MLRRLMVAGLPRFSGVLTCLAISLALLAVPGHAESTSRDLETLQETLTETLRISLEGEDWPEKLSPPMPNHHVDLVADPGGEAAQVLRITFPPGSFYGASLHLVFEEVLGYEPEEALLQYRLYFDESWETSSSGKLPGFSGAYMRGGWGGRPNDGYNGWSARGMFSPTTEAGKIPIGAYVYHTETQVERPDYVYGEGISYHRDAVAPPLERGRWYTVTQYLRLNTLKTPDSETTSEETQGHFDGVLRAWIDSQPVYARQDLRFRHTEDLRIQSAWFDFYHGGKDPAPRELVVYIRDIEVWTTTQE